MRILFVGNANSINFENWVNYFAEIHEVGIVSIPPLTEKERGYPKVKDIFEVEPSRGIRLGVIRRGLKLRKIIKEWKPDVVHGHYLMLAGWTAALARFHPLVITLWGSDVYLAKREGRKAIILNKYALKRADVVTANTLDLINEADKVMAIKEKSKIIQWGVRLDLFKEKEDIIGLRKKMMIPGDAFVFFSPRHLSRHYQVDKIVEAFGKVVATGEKKVVLLISQFLKDNQYQGETKEIIRKKGLTTKVRFIESMRYEEMVKYYQLSDAIVSFPKTDGVATSVLEAMASGAMIVASNVPSMRDWIQNNVNGILVKIDDYEGLERAMRSVMEWDGHKIEKIREDNKKIIEERADSAKEMAKMDTIYKALLGRK